MRNLFKFTIHVGHDPALRKTAGKLPETLEGFGTVHAFFRGTALFVYAEGDGDPFDALKRDAQGKKFLDTAEEHSSFSWDDPYGTALPYRRGYPPEQAAEEREVSA